VGTVGDVDTVRQPNWAVMVRRDAVAYGFAKSIKHGRSAAMINRSWEWTSFDSNGRRLLTAQFPGGKVSIGMERPE
jgi:hypothetical protein